MLGSRVIYTVRRENPARRLCDQHQALWSQIFSPIDAAKVSCASYITERFTGERLSGLSCCSRTDGHHPLRARRTYSALLFLHHPDESFHDFETSCRNTYCIVVASPATLPSTNASRFKIATLLRSLFSRHLHRLVAFTGHLQVCKDLFRL